MLAGRRVAGAARRLLPLLSATGGRGRRRISGGGSGSDPAPSGFGVVFDIDGVLVRGGTPLPGARNVLAYLAKLQKHEDPSKRVPYIFMTNGGGCLEEAKAHEIGDVFFPNLPAKVRPSQVQLSHTPMKALLDLYRDKQILVLGSKDYVHVARAYGFQHVVTVDDVLHAHPELYPFKTYHKRHDLHRDPFAAVFVLHDPVDWAPEIQVLCDVVEGGVLATHPEHADRKEHIPVYSSNSDLVFSSTYSVPRLAQGSFVEAFQHVYRTCYGGPDVKVTRYGKPFPNSYRYAERMLVHEARLMGFPLPGAPAAPHEPHPQKRYPLKTIYAIGDNPASDIDGANAADGVVTNWVSILVRTGVFPADQQHHPARHIVNDVAEALQLILKLEGRPL